MYGNNGRKPQCVFGVRELCISTGARKCNALRNNLTSDVGEGKSKLFVMKL